MNFYVRFALFCAVMIVMLGALGQFVVPAKKHAPISLEGGVPAGIVVAVKHLDDNGVFLVYTSKMLIYAVPATRYYLLKLPVLGYRVTEVPRGSEEFDLFFEEQQILVPAYIWRE